jgi:hypothetical protein
MEGVCMGEGTGAFDQRAGRRSMKDEARLAARLGHAARRIAKGGCWRGGWRDGGSRRSASGRAVPQQGGAFSIQTGCGQAGKGKCLAEGKPWPAEGGPEGQSGRGWVGCARRGRQGTFQEKGPRQNVLRGRVGWVGADAQQQGAARRRAACSAGAPRDAPRGLRHGQCSTEEKGRVRGPCQGCDGGGAPLQACTPVVEERWRCVRCACCAGVPPCSAVCGCAWAPGALGPAPPWPRFCSARCWLRCCRRSRCRSACRASSCGSQSAAGSPRASSASWIDTSGGSFRSAASSRAAWSSLRQGAAAALGQAARHAGSLTSPSNPSCRGTRVQCRTGKLEKQLLPEQLPHLRLWAMAARITPAYFAPTSWYRPRASRRE